MARTRRTKNESSAKATKARKMIAYTRVSTDRQAEEGVSLGAQRAKLEGYARLYEIEIVTFIEDAGYSAGSLRRPGIARALAMLDEGAADGVLVTSLSRLTRSTKDLAILIEDYFGPEGAALVSLGESIDTTSASGRLVVSVLGAVLAWERQAVGERTSAALRHLAAQGFYCGGKAPFGYAPGSDGKLVQVPREQDIIARARKLRREGRTLRDVAATLAADGRLSRTGRMLTATQVMRICSSDA